jgi:Lon protease-like protein
MVLPLHIFEDRYKLMIQHCLKEERPFGVVLIQEGIEVGGGAVPHQVGTTAVIAGVNHLEDGRFNIATVGSERFRLHGVRHDQPYLVGTAEPWPLQGEESDQAWALLKPVRNLFDRYLELAAEAQGNEIEVEEMPTEPRMMALLVAIGLQLPMPQKQKLLSQPTVAAMLLAERIILHREELLLDYIARTQEEQWEGGFSGYLARN